MTINKKISIHAPTRGATTPCMRSPTPSTNFNPRSHEGSDYGATATRPRSTYFNPRSHEGSDRASRWLPSRKSNFNPRSHEGSDGPASGAVGAVELFQSTLPRGERLRCWPRSDARRVISIHAPTRGATLVRFGLHGFEKFQSTLPRGERRLPRNQKHHTRNFNPRSHEGSDAGSGTRCPCTAYFNPRSHEGSDVLPHLL